MKYLTLVHKSKYGYDVHVPALPGCHSQGETEKEALENIKDAILAYLEITKRELKDTKVKEVDIELS
ncbi:MAG: type II toxin-antitoxin system HicB family antitoxin [Candidatus Spechtbacterales bacterium]